MNHVFNAKSTAIEVTLEGEQYSVDLFGGDRMKNILIKAKEIKTASAKVNNEDPASIDKLKKIFVECIDMIMGDGHGQKFFELYDGNLNKLMQLITFFVKLIKEQRTDISNEYLDKKVNDHLKSNPVRGIK